MQWGKTTQRIFSVCDNCKREAVLKQHRGDEKRCLKKRARAPAFICSRSPYETTSESTYELSSPEAAHGPFNRKASERSSMKNPERFNAFLGPRFLKKERERP